MTGIRIDPEAREELISAFEWYEARRPGLGQEFTDAVDEAMAHLAALPEASTPVPGVPADIPARRVFLRRFPYTVVFMHVGEVIVVLAYAHMKRKSGYWLPRVQR
ncbi:MAG: type II toxin-antitoxin system RelE/ParE family toxin [Nannocystaceae bacterium]